jgi:hypothetical protein
MILRIIFALVEDYFRSDDLAQMETEAIRHNITGSDTEVLEYEDFTRCLGSSDVLELSEKSSFHLIISSALFIFFRSLSILSHQTTMTERLYFIVHTYVKSKDNDEHQYS